MQPLKLSAPHDAVVTPQDVAKFFLLIFDGMTIPNSLRAFDNDCMPPGWFRYYASNADLGDVLIQHHMYAQWIYSGLPVFKLDAAALAGFVLTDSSNVELADFKSPFSTFAVQLPQDFWYIDGSPAVTAWFHFYIGENEIGEVNQSLHIDIRSLCGVRLYERIYSPWRFDNLSDFLHFDSGTIHTADQMERTETDVGIIKASRSLFINLCLYVTERNLGERAKPRRAYTRRMREQPSRVSIWELGREVHLDPKIIKAAKDVGNTDEKSRVGWHVAKRFVVRGHWRNQACGPARQVRKRIWIQPHWKGPEEGTKLSHLYTGLKHSDK